MKKRIAYLSVLLLVVGVSFAIAAYTTIPNPGHGGETGVLVKNYDNTQKSLQTAITDKDLSTLNCPDTLRANVGYNFPSNFVGHDAEHISVTIKGVDTTLQEAINNQWLAKDNLSCSFSVTPTSITGPFHDASQIRIRNKDGDEKYLQEAINEGDFFDKCDCEPPSIWLGSASVGQNTANKGSNLLRVSIADGSISQQYTICNDGVGNYNSVGPFTDSTIPQCLGVSGNARFGVGWEDPSTSGSHNGFIAQNLQAKEIWYIVGKGVAHYREQSGQLNFIKYCTQPNGVYSVTLDAAGDAWITTSLSPGGNRKIEIKKMGRKDKQIIIVITSKTLF